MFYHLGHRQGKIGQQMKISGSRLYPQLPRPSTMMILIYKMTFPKQPNHFELIYLEFDVIFHRFIFEIWNRDLIHNTSYANCFDQFVHKRRRQKSHNNFDVRNLLNTIKRRFHGELFQRLTKPKTEWHKNSANLRKFRYN